MFQVFVLNPYQFRVKDIALIVRDCVQRFWTHVGTGEFFFYILIVSTNFSKISSDSSPNMGDFHKIQIVVTLKICISLGTNQSHFYWQTRSIFWDKIIFFAKVWHHCISFKFLNLLNWNYEFVLKENDPNIEQEKNLL